MALFYVHVSAMAKIVVLDGHTLNPGDLDWSELRELGSSEIHDRTPPPLIVSRAHGAEIVLTNKTVLDQPVLASLTGLRYIGVLATGYNVVDVRAAREMGIVVTNVPSYATSSVAQHVFALLLELTTHAGLHTASVNQGGWTRSDDFCYWERPLVELAGLTIGIIGMGTIGRAVAQRALAFEMEVLAHARRPLADPPDRVKAVDLEYLLSRSDVVSLHCPLTPSTAGMIDSAKLSLMKPSAFLINTSRGPLVNEADLAAALREGRLAGAGLDVLAVEPPGEDNPLLTAPNCVITPHIAWATWAARKRLMKTAVDNVRSFLRGKPANVVS